MRIKANWIIILILLGIIAKTSFADMVMTPPAIHLLNLKSENQLSKGWFQPDPMQIKAREDMRGYLIQLQASRIIAASA